MDRETDIGILIIGSYFSLWIRWSVKKRLLRYKVYVTVVGLISNRRTKLFFYFSAMVPRQGEEFSSAPQHVVSRKLSVKWVAKCIRRKLTLSTVLCAEWKVLKLQRFYYIFSTFLRYRRENQVKGFFK